MKKGLYALIAAVLTITFAGCDKEENDAGLKTSTVTSIDAELLGISLDLEYVVKLVEWDDDYIFSEGGIFTNGRIKIDLPEELNSNLLYGILSGYTGIQKSDTKARFAFAKLEGYDEEKNLKGTFDYIHSEKNIIGQLVYADRDVSITGKTGSSVWHVLLKKGWNILYNEGTNISTSDPGGMEWTFLPVFL